MFHPPMLYSGYVGFSIPFAFAIGALVTRRLDAEWIRATRRFALIAWTFLSIGILLGARWSYSELGWGGYWGWDPVENASLMPWLIGTAFLHSMMVQEKRDMLKVWNVSLIVDDVHARAARHLPRSLRDPRFDPRFRRLHGGRLVPCADRARAGGLDRADRLAPRRPALATHRLDSLLSRESIFLLNNLALVGLCFVIFWGTFFPLISEAVTGERSSVGPPWFDRYTVPLALCPGAAVRARPAAGVAAGDRLATCAAAARPCRQPWRSRRARAGSVHRRRRERDVA